MKVESFREELQRRLAGNAERVLLRIAVSGNVEEFTGQQILDRARGLAEQVCPGESRQVILLLLPHSAELFLLHLGLVLQGKVPAILAWPTSRVDAAKYQRNLTHQLRNLPAGQLITLPSLARNLERHLPYPTTSCTTANAAEFEEMFRIPPDLEMDPPVAPSGPRRAAPDDALFLQFSGGTTGAQKAVVVTSAMLVSQLDRLGRFLQFTKDDGVVSWLPLYHDMGLIGCVWLPVWHAAPSLQFSASDWLLNPGSLFEFLSRYRGTFCWLPNFAFSYLAAQKQRMESVPDLSHVRAWISCSEPVRQASMRRFEDAFGEHGVKEQSLQASYAMAETVFAITQTPRGEAPATFPRRDLPTSYPQNAFDLLDEFYVSSGRTLSATELKITRADGSLCQQGEPGEIHVRTESLFSGYWGNDGFAANIVNAEGWYATGDYGFLAKEELFVIGRLKDIVIVGGQNIFPEDVETLVNGISGIYAGRVVAFGVTDDELGTEALAILAELRGNFESKNAVKVQGEIRKAVLSAIGIAPRFVHVLPERWIVKSTAGKISRRETRRKFDENREELSRGLVTAPRG